VLVSRSGKPSPDAASVLDALRKDTEAEIVCSCADVAVESDVVHMLTTQGGMAEWPVAGILHLAGLAGDGFISGLTWRAFVDQSAAKIRGSTYLHMFSRGQSASGGAALALDHFVLFTSIYGLLGNPQLSHYAAANAFQDGLAHSRRQEGLVGLAVSWGTWAGAGMAHRFGAGFEAYWRSQGMGFVNLADGLLALGELMLSATGAHYGYMPAEWAAYARARGARLPQPLTVSLVESARKTNGESAPAARSPLAQKLAPLPPAARSRDLQSEVRALMLELLEVGDDAEAAAAVDFSLPVFELGLTSVHVIGLVNQLSEVTGLDLSPTLIYESVSLHALCDALLEMFNLDASSGAAGPTADARSPYTKELEGLAPSARMLRIESDVRVLMLELLEVGDDAEAAAAVDFSLPVFDLGLTSIHIVGLVNQLSETTGLDLSPTLVYESVSLTALCATLIEMLHVGDLSEVRNDGAADDSVATKTEARLVVAGMACRLPGNANTPAELWANLHACNDAVIPPPADRPTNGRDSGYLSRDVLMGFDNGRFGIGGREAMLMDPQQRLLLHAAYEAFLDAGMPPDKLIDRSVGVFVGISQVEYAALAQEAIHNQQLDTSPYLGPAWSVSIAANRISYLLDLTGPSIALDTACSSSLVAVDLAISAIREGKCSAALVAGVNVQLLRVWSETFAAAGMLGTSQRCHFGADEADGYVRGEGVGAVLIRRLSDVEPEAIDRLYAEVVGAATNQDGKSNGMTAPNPAAQERLLRSAYKNIDSREVRYIEAHGTGTRLGDPIELEALGRVLGNGGHKGGDSSGPHRETPLFVGSVKANIGHLECAAGLASLIKASLIVKMRKAPKTINVAQPNRLVDFERIGVALATDGASLPEAGDFFVGLSGFGFGGTNAHVVLKTLPVSNEEVAGPIKPCTTPFLLVLSAHSHDHLVATISEFAKRLRSSTGPEYIGEDESAAICRSAISLRSHELRINPFRFAAAAKSVAELVSKLEAPKVPTRKPLASSAPRVAFTFTGQGSQYEGMASALYAFSPTFRDAIGECSRLLASFPEWQGPSLEAALFSSELSIDLHRTGFAQPALVALALSLYRVLTSDCGIVPDVVIGHSLGEISACCAGGLLTLEQALRLALVRGAAMQALAPGSGAMLAVRTSPTESATLSKLLKSNHGISIAAVNSRSSCVLSGDTSQIREAERALTAAGVKAKLLDVAHGFHSADVESCLDNLQRSAQALLANAQGQANGDAFRPKVISTLSGDVLTELPPATHWREHARYAVLFEQAITKATSELACSVVVEVGMQAHLTPHAMAFPTNGTPIVAIPTLQKGFDDAARLLDAAGSLFAAGLAVSFDALIPTGRMVQLPVVPFVGSPFWLPEVSAPPIKGLHQTRPSPPPPLLYQPTWVRSGHAPPDAVAPYQKVSMLVIADLLGDLPQAFLVKMQSAAERVALVHTTSEIVPAASGADIELLIFRGDAPCLLASLQALTVKNNVSCRRVVALTQGAVSSSGLSDEALFRDASTWGLIKSARLEMPRTELHAISIDDLSSTESIDHLSSVLSAPWRVPGSFAICGVELYKEVLSLDEVEMAPARSLSAPRAGTALVTGGTGALALQLARWLVESRAMQVVVLCSRSGRVLEANRGLHEALQAAIDKTGGAAKLIIERCDAASDESMRGLLSSHADGLKAGGIFHAAGILDDGLLRSMSAERLQAVAAPKADAARLLDGLLSEIGVQPRHLVLFSSVTSLAGTLGQTNYGAANAVLDALALRRRSSGLPALSVQWGPWGGHGMATGERASVSLWKELVPAHALAALGKALDTAESRPAICTITAIDMTATKQLAQQHAHVQSLLGDVVRRLTGEEAVLNDKVRQSSSNEQENRSVTWEDVLHAARAFVAVDSVPANVSAATSLFDLGLDSLALSALAVDISRRFGASIDVATIINVGTFEELAGVVNASGGRSAYSSSKVRMSPIPSNVSLDSIETSMSVKTLIVKPSRDLRRKVTGEDVLRSAMGFIPADATAGMNTDTGFLDIGLDSLALAALANDISQRFGAAIDVVSLINARDCVEIAEAVNVARGTTSEPGAADGLDAAEEASSGSCVHPERCRLTNETSASNDYAYGYPRKEYDKLVNQVEVLRLCAERDNFEAQHSTSKKVLFILVRILCCTLNVIIGATFPLALSIYMFTELLGAWIGIHINVVNLISYVLAGQAERSDLSWSGLPALMTKGLAFIFFVSAVLTGVIMVLWALVIKKLVGPRLIHGLSYEQWSLTWLRLKIVADTSIALLALPTMLLRNTDLIVVIYRLFGARVGANAVLGMPLTEIAPIAELLDVGNDVLIEAGANLLFTSSDDEMRFTCGRICICSGACVLQQAIVRGGTRLGKGAIAGILSVAQGDIPEDSIVSDTEVLPPSSRRPACCTQATLRSHQGSTTSLLAGHLLLILGINLQLALTFSALVVCALFGPLYGIIDDDGQWAKSSTDLMLNGLVALSLFVFGLPVVLMLYALTAKWCIIGCRRPSVVRITTAKLLREWYVRQMIMLADSIFNPLLSYSPLHNLWYTLFGARIHSAAIFSPVAATCDFELLEVGKDCYTGAGLTYVTQQVDYQLGRSSTVRYHPIRLLPKSFIGPGSVLLPGIMVESDAAVSEKTLVAPDLIIKTGTALLGTRGKVIRYRPDRGRAPAGSASAYALQMLLLWAVRTIFRTFFTIVVPLAIFFASAWTFEPLLASLSPGGTMIAILGGLEVDNNKATDSTKAALVFYAILFPLTAYAVYPLVVQPVYAVCSILFSRMLMGSLATPGKAYGWRTWSHSRWAAAFAVNLRTGLSMEGPLAQLWIGTALPRVFYRLAGATVGRHCLLPWTYPFQPESSLLTFGACFTHTPAAGSMAYSHNFGKGFMEFIPVSIGAAVHASFGTLIGPGTTLPDGTHTGPGSNMTTLTQLGDEQCLIVQGNLPRRCQRTATGEYVHTGSNVQAWEDAASTKRTSTRKPSRGRRVRVREMTPGLLAAETTDTNSSSLLPLHHSDVYERERGRRPSNAMYKAAICILTWICCLATVTAGLSFTVATTSSLPTPLSLLLPPSSPPSSPAKILILPSPPPPPTPLSYSLWMASHEGATISLSPQSARPTPLAPLPPSPPPLKLRSSPSTLSTPGTRTGDRLADLHQQLNSLMDH
jgi:acyl transferase domain-containing protein/acetyltransferase-like isoleucine patch superfamily enzyme